MQRGRVSLKRHVQWAETACEVVNFPPFSFYPDKEVHMQITTNHWNISRDNYVHDATVAWVETVNQKNFKVKRKKILAQWVTIQSFANSVCFALRHNGLRCTLSCLV